MRSPPPRRGTQLDGEDLGATVHNVAVGRVILFAA